MSQSLRKWLTTLLSTSVIVSAVFAQDTRQQIDGEVPLPGETPSESNQEGDLNTNTQNSTVSSYNSSKTYNGAGSSGMPVNSSIAPTLMSNGPETCLQSVTGAMQLVSLGLSAGKYVSDPGCERRRDAMVLSNMGLRLAAISRLCDSPLIFRALLTSSTPCPIVVRGKIVIGRRAYLTISEAPARYIADYEENRELYDVILGTDDDDSEITDDGSMSERFRSSLDDGNRRPSTNQSVD